MHPNKFNKFKMTINIRTTLPKLLLLLVQSSLVIKCQSSASSISTDVQVNSTLSDTLRNTTATTAAAVSTTTIAAATTTSSDVLLSGNEFVDFTEAPTILFDGISNENNETESEFPGTRTTTSSPQQVPTSQSSSTTTSSSTTEAPTVTTITDDLVDGDSDDDTSDEDLHDDNKDSKRDFEPPQNVSQYMDYIEQLFINLRHQITDLFEPHIPQLIRTSQMVQLSGSCSYDMLRMALALRQFEPWALRMIDSSGKVPEGIFEGSFTALGSYDQCLSTVFASTSSSPSTGGTTTTTAQSVSSSGNQQVSQTQGKYCLVNVSPYLPPKPPADRVEHMFQEEANRRNYTKDDQFSRLSPMFYYMKFRIGVCIPSTCLESDVDSISSALSSSLRLNITIPNCRVKQIQPITGHQLVAGIVFALVLALVVGATLMDCSKRKLDFRRAKIVVLDVTSATNTHSRQAEVTTKVPVLISGCDQVQPNNKTQYNFDRRLDKHWSWISFSLMTNYKLYFENKSQKPLEPQTDANLSVPTTRTTTNLTHANSTIIRCLNGIRVLSLCWVIVANSYVTLDPRATKRLTKTREAPKDFLFQIVAQASLAIETFFFLSGVLMSLSYARKLNPKDIQSVEGFNKKSSNKDKNSQLSTSSTKSYHILRWIHFYVHRYVRMTPATMLVIAFTMFAFRYGDGPLWFEATYKAHQSCSQNWWRHLLHVANYIDTRQMCFIHYWYIAADMQLFLFAPLLMFLIYRSRRVGYAIATMIGLLSVGSIFYTTYMRNLPPTLLFYNSDPESRREFGNSIMTKPLTHALPYMVGMLLGKWLFAQASTNPIGREQEMKKTVTSLIGLIATIVALAEVFLPYKWNNSHLPTRFLAALYAALFRFGWSLVLAYVVISCRHRRGRRCRNDEGLKMADNSIGFECRCYKKQQTNNSNTEWNSIGIEKKLNQTVESHFSSEPVVWCMCGSGGSILNRFLSLSIFTHLSKLSFTAYLIHLPLMSVFIAQTRGLFAFSHTLVIHLALSYLVMTFILSFVLVHVIEFPFITFERYLFNKWLYNRNISKMSVIEGKTRGEQKAWTDWKSGGHLAIIKDSEKKIDKEITMINGRISTSTVLISDQSINLNSHELSERL